MDRIFKLQLNCRVKVKLHRILYNLQRVLMEFSDNLSKLHVNTEQLIEVNDILLEIWMPTLPIVGRLPTYKGDDFETTKELDIIVNIDRLLTWIIERLLSNDYKLKEKHHLSLLLVKFWKILLKFVDRLESADLLSIRKRELDTILLGHWKTISYFINKINVLELDKNDMAELHRVLFCLRRITATEMDKVELIELTHNQRDEVQKILLNLRWIASWLNWTLSGLIKYKDEADKKSLVEILDFFTKIVTWLVAHEPISERILYNKRELQTVLLILQSKISHLMDILPKLKLKRKVKVNKASISVREAVYCLIDEIPIFKLNIPRVENIRYVKFTSIFNL